jgi:hypothetical protein
MTRLPSLKAIAAQVLADGVADDWRTTTEIADRLGLNHGIGWYRLALAVERLTVDGIIEIKKPGSTVRRFRRKGT